MIQRRLKQPYLSRAPHCRQEKDNPGMQLDLPISPAKLDRVVGHQDPVLLGDDLQQIPVCLRAQAKVVDVHRFKPPFARGCSQSG